MVASWMSGGLGPGIGCEMQGPDCSTPSIVGVVQLHLLQRPQAPGGALLRQVRALHRGLHLQDTAALQSDILGYASQITTLHPPLQ